MALVLTGRSRRASALLLSALAALALSTTASCSPTERALPPSPSTATASSTPVGSATASAANGSSPAPARSAQARADGGSTDAGASRWSPDVGLPKGWPPAPLGKLLGQRRAQVEQAVGSKGEVIEEGWTRYHRSWMLRYERDCAVELRAQMPAGMSCEQAAELLGFRSRGFPLRRRDRCEWPGISMRHRLGARVAARLDFETAVFHVWRLDEARRCDSP